MNEFKTSYHIYVCVSVAYTYRDRVCVLKNNNDDDSI